MISTELATRILLTVIIVGAFTINYSIAGSTGATATTTNSSPNEESHSVKRKTGSVNIDEQSSSLDSPVALSSSSPTSVESPRSFDQIIPEEDAGSRLFSDSAEAGILLPYEDDFPHPARDNPRGFPDREETLPGSIAFPGRPIALRIANGKALEQPRESFYGMDPGQAFREDEKKPPTYFLRNSCFGPRCLQQQSNNNDPTSYFSSKEGKAKKYDGGSRSNNLIGPATRYEDNVMESMSSNFHSQLAIPFMVVDENSMKGGSLNSKYSNRLGLLPDRFSRMTTTMSPVAPEGWVKLNAISPDAYDPFRFTRNHSTKVDDSKRSTFNKRDSSSSASNMLTKRVGVELNPESFADRWGWNENNNNNEDQDRRGGSRLPAWLEDQLKYGNRNSDQDKNWVKLEPIPVAGVTISKWVPKGTPLSKLPTTNWQTNRDRPNAGSQWWDRIDDINRLSPGGSRPFLRPSGGNDDGGRYNGGGGGHGGGGGSGGGWGSKGSSLSSFDRYPTNSWNDIIYPDGPQSATVSWQQSKGMSNRPSSFGPSSSQGGDSGGWGSGGGSDTRHTPPIATGSWSAPPSRNRYPSSSNRFNDHRSSSYPNRQASEDDPRWVLISNTRRVTSGSPNPNPNYNRGHDLLDRSKILSYINRLHPDLDRRSDFPFYEPSPSPPSSSHRHGKDYWPLVGGLSTSTVVVSPNKDEAFHRVNATLSTLTPVLIHRGGTTVSQQSGDSSQSQPSRFESSIFQEDNAEDASSNTDSNTNSDIILGSTVPSILSTYFGDGRATSNSAAFLQSSTITPFRNRNSIPGRIRQGLRNIHPVYAAVGAGMIPATLAAVMPMMLGRRRRRRDIISSMISQHRSLNHFPYFLLSSALYSNNNKRKILDLR